MHLAKPSNLFYALLLRVFGVWFAGLGKELGLEASLELKGMKAAYYPIWRCDAIFQNNPSASTSTKQLSVPDGSPSSMVIVREGYMPGRSPLHHDFLVPRSGSFAHGVAENIG